MYFEDSATALATCVERLGERAGRQLVALARTGFLLQRPAGTETSTGLCRLGGPAMLEPETAWPYANGFPLSLLAVLDVHAFAGQLDEILPRQFPVLLNFFHADPDVPYEQYSQLDLRDPATWRVVPADSALAVRTSAPAPAHAYPEVPVHAAEVAMLPNACDVQDGDVEFDKARYWGAMALLWEAMEGLDGNTADRHIAFGWPDTSYTNPVTLRDADGPEVHLLQLAQDAELGWGWGDAATLNFTIPAGALAAGDFTRARLTIQSC